MDSTRLVLGAAQLGMDYGVANTSGRPGPDESLALVRQAWEGGVREFDTAQAYGESEGVLGRILGELGLSNQALVVTKPAAAVEAADSGKLVQSAEISLAALKIPRLHGFILHDENQLDLWDKGLSTGVALLKSKGLIRFFGVSVYSPKRALRAIELDGLDLIQIPSNILDRRFERAGVLEAAKERGKRIYVRSVFLQGLLLADPNDMPGRMAMAGPVVRRFRELAGECGLSPFSLALAFAREAWPGAGILFGAETREQVRENLLGFKARLEPGLVERARELFADLGEELLNPSLWPK